MTIAKTKAAFLKAIRENVKAEAKKLGVRLTQFELNEIVSSQASDAIYGYSTKFLKKHLKYMLTA
jgi:hypothetical protein